MTAPSCSRASRPREAPLPPPVTGPPLFTPWLTRIARRVAFARGLVLDRALARAFAAMGVSVGMKVLHARSAARYILNRTSGVPMPLFAKAIQYLDRDTRINRGSFMPSTRTARARGARVRAPSQPVSRPSPGAAGHRGTDALRAPPRSARLRARV